MDQLVDARILVVEDEDSDLRLLDQLLRSNGFNNVGLTSDPIGALERFDPDATDLVILDLWMPGLDGFAVLRQIREKCPPDMFLPVIVVTADASLDTKRRALVAGATDFLTKPVDVVEVTLRVRHLLEVRRLQAALANEHATMEQTVTSRTVELADANAQLQELVKAKDHFVAGVSHELRTPLTGVLELARELAEHPARLSSAEVEEIARVMAEEATEAASIIEDLLVVARADIKDVTVRHETVDLRPELDAALRSLRSGTRATISLPTNSVVAHADRQRVRQILRNLLGNALRHGGPNIAVAVGTRDRMVEVTVSDDGPGVPSDHGSHLFDPYFRGAEAPPVSTGLGLMVSRQLARLMGGDLTYSPASPGSSFRLTLPAASL